MEARVLDTTRARAVDGCGWPKQPDRIAVRRFSDQVFLAVMSDYLRSAKPGTWASSIASGAGMIDNLSILVERVKGCLSMGPVVHQSASLAVRTEHR